MDDQDGSVELLGVLSSALDVGIRQVENEALKEKSPC